MKFSDIIRWSLRQIRTRLLESLLIALGIGLGIAVVCSVMGLTTGFNENSRQFSESIQFRSFQIRPIEISYGVEAMRRALVPLRQSDQEQMKLTIQDYYATKEAGIKGAEYVWVSRNISEMTKEFTEEQQFENFEEERNWIRENSLRIVMGTPDIFNVVKLKLLDGDLFRDSDVKDMTSVVVLGKDAAKKHIPSDNPIGEKLRIGERDFTVIGVVETQLNPEKERYIPGLGMVEDLNYSLYIPYTSSYYDYYNGNEDFIQEIQILPAKDINLAKFYSSLNNWVQNKYGNQVVAQGNYLSLQESKKQLSAVQKTIGIFASIALLIAAVNILNLMMARVLRRYKNIGISAAVGASRFDIFKLFIYEAIILGFFGSLIGLALTFGAFELLENILHQQLNLTYLTALIGVAVAFATSLIFGLYPASQAARIEPVDALRVE